MIKSRLATLVLSMGLATVVAISGIFLNSDKENTQEKVVKAEVIEDNSDKLDKEEEVNYNDTNSNEENLESKTIESEENTNEKVVNKPKVVQNTPEVNNSEPTNNNSATENIAPPEVPEPQPKNSETQPVTPAPQPVAIDNSNYIGDIEQAIFQIVNQRREEAGLTQLSYNANMQYYARIKSKDMGDRGYFNHVNPDGVYMNQIIKADGISYRAWGENIAYIEGLTDYGALANRFMSNWMNSQGHKDNILSSNFSSIGIGVYKAGDTYYATQEFYN